MRCHHECGFSALYVHAQRTMCTTQSLVCVVLGELHVVRADRVVVCDDVVRRTLVLIALCRNHCFHRSHFP